MRVSQLLLILAVSAAMPGIGQALLPTAHAQQIKPVMIFPAEYRVRVASLHARRMTGSLEITGQIVNTGRQALTYTSVTAVYINAAGQEVARSGGYLTAGPLLPGQAAGFRACSLETPAFSHVTLRLREAGHTVIVDMPRFMRADAQASDSHRTTVW